MRKVITKATAIRAVVLIFALIGILLIFPIRVFTTTLETSGGGTFVGESEPINFERGSLTQEFVAQYARLSSIDLFVNSVEQGRYISALIYDENGGIVLATYVDTQGQTLPGYVNIPLELNIEVGKTYAIKLMSCRSKYTVGLENVPETAAYVGNLTMDYVNQEGRHLAARYNYRLPISRKTSVILILLTAAFAAALIFVSESFFKKNPDRNTILTAGDALKFSANPVATVIFGALMIMVFPLKVFDSRVLDIIFYEIGLIICAAIVFYAINHKAVKRDKGISFWQSIDSKNRIQYVLIMLALAMTIWYASDYMNDLYDIFHTVSERRMAIWFLIAVLLTFTFREVFNVYNLLWLILSGICAVRYYGLHKLAPEENESDLQNLILKYAVIIAVLGGLVVINFIRLLVTAVASAKKGEKGVYVRPSAFGVLLLAFLVMIVVLRNTRIWGIYLAVTFICFYIRLAAWGKKKDYYKILAGALMMNFAISLCFSLLHRYFAGYVSGRFAFIFHTVTVTAEYFTFMGAAALVMLLVKIVSLPKKSSFRELVISAWKEMTLFGFVMSYAIFTVSRTAYLAIAVSALLVICVVISYHRKQFVRILAVLIASVLICFPAAFTLQRIIPTMAADPVFYPIDDTDEFVRGGADWDNTNFMCVERFVNLFESKILGMDVGTYEYPIDAGNYDVNGTGEPLYDLYGRPYEESPDNPKNADDDDYGMDGGQNADMLLASSVFTAAEYAMLLEEMAGYVDSSNIIDVISNGRITIFKSYIQELNMWGHEEMGAMLPNGEIAVHAHNTYLQVAYDHGIVAGALFIIVLAAGLFSSIGYYRTNRDKEPLSLMTCGVIIGFAVAGISEWVFQYGNPMTVALMLALAPLTYKVYER